MKEWIRWVFGLLAGLLIFEYGHYAEYLDEVIGNTFLRVLISILFWFSYWTLIHVSWREK